MQDGFGGRVKVPPSILPPSVSALFRLLLDISVKYVPDGCLS